MQVVKYCALAKTKSKGFLQRVVPRMLLGFLAMYAAKFSITKIPNLGSSVSPVLDALPAIIVGPLIGLALGVYQGGGTDEALQRRLFKNKDDGTGASTSQR